jgi:hypothetical protein
MTTTDVRMSEQELLTCTIELAELFGWRAIHHRPAMNRRGHWSTAMSGTQAAGWPDLLLCRERLIAIELKSERGTVTPDQQSWLAALGKAGVEVHLWRPADWQDGTIESALRRRRS